jgi:serine/threonine protein kinase
MPRRLFVIDGADHGRSYRLPDEGSVLIGNNSRHSQICLNDLYVARIHCEVQTGPDRVLVVDKQAPTGTLVNGQKVTQSPLAPGDVLRVGNSHLRLEEAAEFPPDTPDRGHGNGSAAVPRLCLDRLSELAGETLGHFRLGPALGAGPHGVVFRAHDSKSDRNVALKVLSPEFPADEPELQRFAKVMKAVLPLRDPALVTLHGVGKVGPYVWLASDLVNAPETTGPERRQVRWRAALRAAVRLARLLEFLREQHMVHGDITPNSVIVPDDGQAVVTDLGLAHALACSDLQHRQRDQKHLASLPYLSPEHLDPTAPVDDLSDQYGLGTVVYTLLTGRAPFGGRSTEEIEQHVRESRPERPKMHARGLPDEFQAAVLRMMAKRPEDRYPGPGPLVTELERMATEHSVDV